MISTASKTSGSFDFEHRPAASSDFLQIRETAQTYCENCGPLRLGFIWRVLTPAPAFLNAIPSFVLQLLQAHSKLERRPSDSSPFL